MTNAVTEVPAASPEQALVHFQSAFAFETDCWDTHDALQSGAPGFVLIDVRSPELYARGHVPGAINIPYRKIIASRMAAYADEALFVVYCAGPHCIVAARAALQLARLGRSGKVMVGGITGWQDEGFDLATGV